MVQEFFHQQYHGINSWDKSSSRVRNFSPEKPPKTDLGAEIWHPNGGSRTIHFWTVHNIPWFSLIFDIFASWCTNSFEDITVDASRGIYITAWHAPLRFTILYYDRNSQTVHRLGQAAAQVCIVLSNWEDWKQKYPFKASYWKHLKTTFWITIFQDSRSYSNIDKVIEFLGSLDFMCAFRTISRLLSSLGSMISRPWGFVRNSWRSIGP